MHAPGNERDSVVLVAARDQAVRSRLVAHLEDSFNVVPVASAHAGERELARGGVAVALVSTDLADMTGLDWLGQLRRRREIPAIRIFAPEQSSEALAIAAVNVAGVFRYVAQPDNGAELRRAVDQAVELVGHRAGPPCMREAVGQAIKAHHLCRNSKIGCLIKVGQEDAPTPPWLIRRISSLAGWTGMGVMSMALLLLAGLVMGIGVLTVLYVIKSMLGIDMVEGWHLSDWLRK